MAQSCGENVGACGGDLPELDEGRPEALKLRDNRLMGPPVGGLAPAHQPEPDDDRERDQDPSSDAEGDGD
jgi:hypothetical protein